ncbi:MAG: electron transfer flavoprotein subunit alpha/FixB family protein [Deltaproteobacteria bacterium]|jgi:electron transfer flavoprotein alpha subunit|nr:electron transfer flavoprotein subunit alpha/FixB family protein [Deltaproteobacteria bacterium]
MLDEKKSRDLVLILLELEQGEVTPGSRSLARTARELSRQGGLEVRGVLPLGAWALPSLESLAGLDLSKIYAFASSGRPTSGQTARQLIAAVELARPSVVLVGATELGREVAPLAAAHFQTGLTADCTGLRLEGDLLVQTRPAFSGEMLAEIVTPLARPQMATVRAAPEPPETRRQERLPRVEFLRYREPERDLTVLRRTPLGDAGDLVRAPVVVAAGLGLGGPAGVASAAWLAEKLGAALGGTRAVVDRGWLPADKQIGLSGLSVSPRLLVALGVSGSVQFMAGAAGAGTIVAVNSDPRAPILALAQFGLVMELENLWPEFEDIFNTLELNGPRRQANKSRASRPAAPRAPETGPAPQETPRDARTEAREEKRAEDAGRGDRKERKTGKTR